MVGAMGKQKEAQEKEALELFLRIGLEERTAQNAVANAKVTSNLCDVIHEAGVHDGCSKFVGNLLYTVATKFPANAFKHRPFLLQYITCAKVKNVAQVEAAMSFFSSVGSDTFNIEEFEQQCGVGVEVSIDEIRSAVDQVVLDSLDSIKTQRYKFNVGLLFGKIRQILPWADGKFVKEEMDTKMRDLLGEKTAEDEEKPVKKKREKVAKSQEPLPATVVVSCTEESNPFLIFPDPRENIQVHTEIFFSDGRIWRPRNSKETLEKHLKVTGGKTITRFPPEPNGYLHIGHAKAMFVNFGLAKDRGGNCYLRFDDTNPEAEKTEYINHIQEIVKWMGWKPSIVTYSSDYFQDLYDLAIQLIKAGYAYVDHQTPEEIKEYREKKRESPWRNRSVAECLKLFDEMRRGMIEEGKATLRMKQDMKSDNYNMFDLIAYRIKYSPHPHAGDKWCIYPSYDYTHCIVDSLENITHSVPFTKVVYIDSSDFRLVDSKDYYGLAPGKTVMLRYAFPIKCTNVLLAEDQKTVIELHAEYDQAKRTKPKGVIHWVSEPSPGQNPLQVEVRLFDHLFLSENPNDLDDWLADLNPNSKVLVPNAFAVPCLKDAKLGDKYQFERLGYFAIDPDSMPAKLVFNRIVTLRDSYAKVSGR